MFALRLHFFAAAKRPPDKQGAASRLSGQNVSSCRRARRRWQQASPGRPLLPRASWTTGSARPPLESASEPKAAPMDSNLAASGAEVG